MSASSGVAAAKGFGARALAGRSDLLLAAAVIGILVVLILPLPAPVLDLLLAASIILSVLILMTALFVEEPTDFSSFPSILLIATMLRLALNLASTRLILAEGHKGPSAAGHVIEAFGGFVMGGNFVIGVIVFLILALVNFVVITKGSGRIAEVAARFTLDALPGKQMAIDADLSAGVIDEAQARARRKALEDEASFFGAMDGASKFVRGDAVAGLIITAINVVGGFVIGVAQMGLSAGEAARTYTLLTVGDGLVTQIPALIVSTAAGLLVSKAGIRGAADKAMSKQLAGMPKALAISSATMAGMALLPGIPAIPFLALAAGAGLAARAIARARAVAPAPETGAAAAPTGASAAGEEPIAEALRIDEIRIEIGYALLPLARGAEGEDRLARQIRALRRELAAELGFVMPSVRIVDDVRLGANAYVIRVKEIEAGAGEVFPEALMAMDPQGQVVDLPGQHRREPTFGLPAIWIDPALREEAELRGLTVVDPQTVIATHLVEVARGHMPELLSYAQVQGLLKDLPREHADLWREIAPKEISAAGLQRVLQALLAERVSIRDLPTIIEAVAEIATATRDPGRIVEHVRQRLARQICARCAGPDGRLPIVTLAGAWETAFAEAIEGEGEQRRFVMAPSRVAEFAGKAREALEEAARGGDVAALVCSAQARPFARQILERVRRDATVLSHAEIDPRARLKPVGVVG